MEEFIFGVFYVFGAGLAVAGGFTIGVLRVLSRRADVAHLEMIHDDFMRKSLDAAGLRRYNESVNFEKENRK